MPTYYVTTTVGVYLKAQNRAAAAAEVEKEIGGRMEDAADTMRSYGLHFAEVGSARVTEVGHIPEQFTI